MVLQAAEDAEERTALEAADKHMSQRAAESTARTDALWEAVGTTQKVLVSTEASLRKLLDDHLIALTEQMQNSLSNSKSSLLGTLGRDRDEIRQEFAEDVGNISSRLVQLANDTASEGLELTESLDATAAQEASSHVQVMHTLRSIEQQQSTHKQELDALVALLASELASTKKALASIKAQTRARQQADLKELQAKASSSLSAAKTGMQAALQVLLVSCDECVGCYYIKAQDDAY